MKLRVFNDLYDTFGSSYDSNHRSILGNYNFDSYLYVGKPLS